MPPPHSRIQHYRKLGAESLVRKEGFEPPRPFGHKILSLARLPVPPLPQWCFYSTSLPRAAPPRFSADALSLLRPSLVVIPSPPRREACPSLLSVPLAAYSGQNAQFAQDQHIQVCRQLVQHQARIPIVPIRSRSVSFDAKYE